MVCASQRWIDDLRYIVHPEANEATIFAMIKAYLDESGIHDGAAICTVAGYAAPWRQWKKFTPKWQSILKKVWFGTRRLSREKSFFFCRGTDYKDWKEADTIECFNHLIGVINGIKATPIGEHVWWSMFFRVST